MSFFIPPKREYAIIALVSLTLALNFFSPEMRPLLFIAALLGSLPTFLNATRSITQRKISIDTFNVFALIVAFVMLEIKSAAFIVLMLAFASLLDWKTESRTQSAVEELLRLKPQKAKILENGAMREIPYGKIKEQSVILVETGSIIPVDGLVIFGKALVNESSVTGESVPSTKTIGDNVLGGTLNEAGVLKVRATRVGKDSTIERMAELIRQAEKHKSKSEKLADRFAFIFLPVVIGAGIISYIFTHNIIMTAALFLVACADDMAVAIPLAVTASLGRAAHRGVIIKGGEWLDKLGKIDTLILDKTGTLTFGNFILKKVFIENNIQTNQFWRIIGIAEKFSEHPIGRIIFHEALKRVGEIPDPDEIKIYPGGGIWARIDSDEVAAGTENFISSLNILIEDGIKKDLERRREEAGGTIIIIAINRKYAGFIAISDSPRPEAAESLKSIRGLGVKNIIMFTGDNEMVAARMAEKLGIESFKASMKPEDKLTEIEKLEKKHIIAMVGDGINDAPALARSDVGIAMGSGGAAVTVAAADIVILTDNLNRIPEMIALGRKASSVIKLNIITWLVTNILGFALVLSGIAGLALAAFYNFLTDFAPILNSARLFEKNSQ